MDELEHPRDMLDWDRDISRWYTNLMNRSSKTANTYLPRLFKFFKWMLVERNTTHTQFVNMSNKNMGDMVMDYRDYRQDVDRVRGSSIITDLKPIKSWAEHMDRPIKKKISVDGAYDLTPKIEEERIPVDKAVLAACELLGFDPLYIANEGKAVCAVAAADADNILAAVRRNKYGAKAAIIGEVVEDHPGQVVMNTRLGASRIVDMPVGELLPRIC